MVKCIFCGLNIERGTGLFYVLNDGRLLNFCSSKCKKNQLKLGRKAIHVKWSEYYKKEE